MKVVGFTALHYGREFLAWSIRSVIADVDEFHVAYTPVGSHGSRTDIPCPEHCDELYALAESVAGSKLRWHEGIWNTEGEQRSSIFRYAPDADVVVVVDSDEILQPRLARLMIDTALSRPDVSRWRIPFRHYWKSFYQCILHDPAYPVRIHCPKFKSNVELTMDTRGMAYNHMGYCQSAEIVHYKMQTHGHLAQFRTDIDWFRDRYMNPEAKTDLHVVGSEYWNYEEVDPFAERWMPTWMTGHPYATLDVTP